MWTVAIALKDVALTLPRPLQLIRISSTRHMARVRKQTRICASTLSVFWWKTCVRCRSPRQDAESFFRLRELHIPCPQLVGIFVCAIGTQQVGPGTEFSPSERYCLFGNVQAYGHGLRGSGSL